MQGEGAGIFVFEEWDRAVARGADILADHAVHAGVSLDVCDDHVIVVDHGSPLPQVNAVRRYAVEALRQRLPKHIVIEQAAMERRDGADYQFNGELLGELLDRLDIADMQAPGAVRFRRTISEEIGLTQLKTKEIVQKTFEAIVDALVEDGRIELRNFGVFEVKKRAGRKARNPRTGDPVDVPEKYVVTFKPGKEMEERVRLLEEREAAAEQAIEAKGWTTG